MVVGWTVVPPGASRRGGAYRPDGHFSGPAQREEARMEIAIIGSGNAVLAEAGGALDGKVVIDTTNRVDPAAPGSTLDGTSSAEQIQARAPGAKVVKAFNTAFASRQADPVVDGVALDGFLAGDDDQAKRTVTELVDSIGFRPIDVGPLVMARALEALALLNIMLQIRNNWPWQAGFKLVGPTG
jgi:8-hydroxy-5-deazaflavin:NADPH oxidoreductase